MKKKQKQARKPAAKKPAAKPARSMRSYAVNRVLKAY